jgi:soluble lytic murein transglycosylase
MTQNLWGILDKEDISILKHFSIAIKQDDYLQALKIAEQSREKISFSNDLYKIALWNKYSQIDSKKINPKDISFNDISSFVSDNHFLPNLIEIRKSAEKVAIANKISYQFSKQYFNNFPPINTDSKIYLLNSNQDEQRLQKDIVDVWINKNFSAQAEKKFLSDYGNRLNKENYIARINRLIWDNKNDDAERILYLVNDNYQKLFAGIMAIDKNSPTLHNIISNIPRSLRSNDLLSYKVITWHKNNKTNLVDIINILKDVPENTSNPQKWWPIRKLYGRELLKTKDYKTAYKILSKNGLTPQKSDILKLQNSDDLKLQNSNFADAEWTSGWVALRFLNKPQIAYDHFNNLYLNVDYPISISRATYWLGMSAESMGDKQKAIGWYKIATQYPVYFYGQLAANKRRALDNVNFKNGIILPNDPNILQSDVDVIAKEDAVKIAYLLSLIGDQTNSTKIFEYAVENAKTDGQIAVIMKVVNEFDNQELDVRISKVAAKRNVFFIQDKFQIIKQIESHPQSPLAHAIIKQESGFAPDALSPVGAVGFMQIMPETAKMVCGQMGIKYNRKRLATDIDYNIAIGFYYIQYLIDKFDGSELLAIASYNAGPTASKRWVDEFYDPRKEQDIDKVVDWIELITYSETRNYVQRIMENLIVYKYLMSRVNHDQIK